MIYKHLKSVSCRKVDKVVIKKDIRIIIFVICEKEKSGTCIHLQGERNFGELVLHAADGIHAKDEIGRMTDITAFFFRIVEILLKGGTDVQAAADEPVEAVPCGSLIHKIWVEGKDDRDIMVLIIPHEAITQVQLHTQIIGREELESKAIKKTGVYTNTKIIGCGILTGLGKRD